MGNSYILGTNVKIRLWEDGGLQLLAGCNTTDTISLDSEFVEVTPPEGKFRAYRPTYIGGSMSFDSVLFFEGADPNNSGITQQLSWIINRVPLNFAIRWDSNDLHTGGIDGTCYVQNISITGAVNEYATGNISVLISGEFTLYEDYS